MMNQNTFYVSLLNIYSQQQIYLEDTAINA